MVLLNKKIGTLCIEYRPPETIAALCFDDGMLNEDDCDLFVLNTKFFPGYVPLIPIYALDAKCYSRLNIKCYSVFDALDFVDHLDLREFEFTFLASRTVSSGEARDEYDITSIYFEGSRLELWSLRIKVAQKNEPIVITNRESPKEIPTAFKIIYEKQDQMVASL
ncbi:MAG: hypothetical protein EOO53_11755 [Gammaproteobacteria bacterium]|nr:MAG: hypothetical protein EOO53_11755 [Gammaproteobacteria bacterium]